MEDRLLSWFEILDLAKAASEGEPLDERVLNRILARLNDISARLNVVESELLSLEVALN